MSSKKHLPRRISLDAKSLIDADAELTAQHRSLVDDGYMLAPRARCYRCRDRSLTVQLNWTKRRQGGSSTYTVTIRGL